MGVLFKTAYLNFLAYTFFWKFAERVGKSQEKEIRERKTNGREGSRKSKYMRYVYTGLKKKYNLCNAFQFFYWDIISVFDWMSFSFWKPGS